MPLICNIFISIETCLNWPTERLYKHCCILISVLLHKNEIETVMEIVMVDEPIIDNILI